jgi:hypothetical protein
VLYRKNLVDRCEARAGDEEAGCAEGCACQDKDAGKLAGKCKRACARCRGETAQRLRLCKKITDAPTAVVRAPRPAPPPTWTAPVPLPRAGTVKEAPPPKKIDTGKGLKPVEM